ncbi:MAG TPA: response regulator, partial [Ramlibacter sp.]|nr:response regulator [Ramlibacter sp.]
MADCDMILLALDPSSTLDLLERALRPVDFEVMVVSSQERLLQALQESSPALMIIGQKFDNKHGLQIAQGQLERFPTMPILLFAESERPELARKVLAAGLSGYLCPPLRTDDIVDTVKRSLRRAQQLGDWIRREVKQTTSSLERRAQISESERLRL